MAMKVESTNSFAAVAASTHAALDDIADEAGAEGLEEMNAATPERTGRLKAGNKLVKTGDGQRELQNDVPYAAIIEFGREGVPGRYMATRGGEKMGRVALSLLRGLEGRIKS
jgi:hypothetical protein